ncbi:MAG: hypothetical protein ABI992_07135 [Chthoniobacterales bacterium]
MNESPSATTNPAVQKRPTARVFSGAVSLLLAAAWLLASNHCAVAGFALKNPAEATHEHCAGHGGSGQPQKDKGCDDQNCCKSLNAPSVTLAKSPVSFDQFHFVTADYFATVLPARGQLHPAVIFELDTGPPGLSSFAESVLQRSLLAHAPPSLA